MPTCSSGGNQSKSAVVAGARRSKILDTAYGLEERSRAFLKQYPGLQGQYNLELVQCTPYLSADERRVVEADYTAVFESLKWTRVPYTSRLENLVPASKTPFKDCITFCWYAYCPYSRTGTRLRTLYQNVLFKDSSTWFMTNKQAMLRRMRLFEATVKAAIDAGLVAVGPLLGPAGLSCDAYVPPTQLYSPGREAEVSAGLESGRTYIVKPAAGLQGRGIQLYRGGASTAEFGDFVRANYGGDLQQTAARSSFFVVQQYVEQPLLIRGRKFDLRVYLLIVPNMNCCSTCDSCPSRRGFYAFYHPGFARLSCLEYGQGSSTDRRVHLTNCCVQRQAGPDGACCDWNDVNWTPDQVNEYFNRRREDGLDGLPCRDWFRTKCQTDIQGILAHVLMQFSRLLITNSANAFRLLGCDFLIDRNLRPWLLEMNSLPSLRLRSPCHRAVKTVMQREALALAVEVAHRTANGLPVTSQCLVMRRNFRLVHSASNARLQAGLVMRFFQRRLQTTAAAMDLSSTASCVSHSSTAD